jgi:hypothetical protein
VDERKLKRVLWENVSGLMKKVYGRENVTRLGRDASIGGTASRLKEQDTSVGIDVVLKVAKVFKASPHELLMTKDEKDEIAKLKADLAAINDKNILRIARIYVDTDDEGRRVIDAGAQIAATRIKHGRSAGMGESGKADD